MRIVIVGDGKVGFTLAEQLSQEGHDIVVIDSNGEALKASNNTLDVICIEGNGASYEVQMKADVGRADVLIAATSTDEMNMLCCLLAKKHGAKHTIARVRNPEYFEQLHFLKDELGLSMSINPELAAANEISRILRFPSAIKIEAFAKGRVELVELKIAPGSALDGMPLFSMYHEFKVKVLVCVVQRNNEVYIPDGSFILKGGDKINITATRLEIEGFVRSTGMLRQKVKTVLIIGGGRLAYYLAKQLLAVGMQVKIVEKQKERCNHLCMLLPKAMIIQGDGTEKELLEEEGIDKVHGFVALTGIDEENIIISMYAKSKKVPKIITKVNRLSLNEILDEFGIDSIISPKIITANNIIRYVRAMQNSFGSNVETLYKLVNGRVEALEFRVRENIPFTGKALKEIKTKDNLLIASIIRKGKIIIPGGDDTIEIGDSVIVVTTKQRLSDLNDIID